MNLSRLQNNAKIIIIQMKIIWQQYFLKIMHFSLQL